MMPDRRRKKVDRANRGSSKAPKSNEAGDEADMPRRSPTILVVSHPSCSTGPRAERSSHGISHPRRARTCSRRGKSR